MMKRAGRRSLRRSFTAASATMILLAGMWAGLSAPVLPMTDPNRIPPAPPLGTRRPRWMRPAILLWSVEPTDKTAPDYAQNKKAFDEYQAQAAKEPLAVKLADASATFASPPTSPGR